MLGAPANIVAGDAARGTVAFGAAFSKHFAAFTLLPSADGGVNVNASAASAASTALGVGVGVAAAPAAGAAAATAVDVVLAGKDGWGRDLLGRAWQVARVNALRYCLPRHRMLFKNS
jgi:hypothetical protein